MDFEAPLWALDVNPRTIVVCAVALGAVLSVFCRIAFRAFAIWGFLVGSVGLMLFWLMVVVLPLKWGLILAAALALPVAVAFYVDEHSIVTPTELTDAARLRESDLNDLFDSDPESAESMAKTLNLGIDDAPEDFSASNEMQEHYRAVGKRALFFLVVGYSLLAMAAVGVATDILF